MGIEEIRGTSMVRTHVKQANPNTSLKAAAAKLRRANGIEEGKKNVRINASLYRTKDNSISKVRKILSSFSKSIRDGDKTVGLGESLQFDKGTHIISNKDKAKVQVIYDRTQSELTKAKAEVIKEFDFLMRQGKDDLEGNPNYNGRELLKEALPKYPTDAEEFANEFQVSVVFMEKPLVTGNLSAVSAIADEAMNRGIAAAMQAAQRQATLEEKAFANELDGLGKLIRQNIGKLDESHNKKNGRWRNENMRNILNRVDSIKDKQDRFGVTAGPVADLVRNICNTILSDYESLELPKMDPPEREELLEDLSKKSDLVLAAADDLLVI